MGRPTLVMIHGMWSRPSTFARLRSELEAAGIRSCALTLPYHDLPPQAPAPAAMGSLGLEDYAAAVVRDLRTLEGDIILLGHSMGGLVAQLAACQLDPKGLILLSSAPSAQASSAAFSFDSLKTTLGVTKGWGWWKKPTKLGEKQARFGVFNGVSETETREALSQMTWDSGRVLAQIAAPFLDRTKSSYVSYEKITCPSLVITGNADRIVPAAVARRTARLLAENSRTVDYEEWPDVGHWLFHDAVRPRTAGAIGRFIASLG